MDGVVILFYPVHRYHCRSFVCNCEGNLRYTPDLGRWEALESYTDSSPARLRGADDRASSAMATEPPTDATARRESDTLPLPSTRSPKTKKPDALAQSRDRTNAPRRAKKRGKAASH